MFEKILVAVDGSPLSERVLASLEPLLLRPTTELLLVRVIAKSGERHDEHEHAEGLRYLQTLEARLDEQGIRASGHLLIGKDPAAEIVSFAAKSGASLLCIGTHGRTGLKRVALGSVAERIVRAADTPVLLLNALVPPAPIQFKRVVIPLDGSERSEEVFPVARHLAKHEGSHLILVRVEDRTVLASPVLVADEHALTVKAFERAKNALAGAKVETLSRVGFPGEEVLRAIAETAPDVVLVTTHGRTGLARLALGSVTEEILRRAPVPVLVKRSIPALSEKIHERSTAAR